MQLYVSFKFVAILKMRISKNIHLIPNIVNNSFIGLLKYSYNRAQTSSKFIFPTIFFSDNPSCERSGSCTYKCYELIFLRRKILSGHCFTRARENVLDMECAECAP